MLFGSECYQSQTTGGGATVTAAILGDGLVDPVRVRYGVNVSSAFHCNICEWFNILKDWHHCSPYLYTIKFLSGHHQKGRLRRKTTIYVRIILLKNHQYCNKDISTFCYQATNIVSDGINLAAILCVIEWVFFYYCSFVNKNSCKIHIESLVVCNFLPLFILK